MEHGETMIFFISDDVYFELTDYFKIKQLVEHSSENYQMLVDLINEKLIESVNEELAVLNDPENVNIITRSRSTLYARLLQAVCSFKKVDHDIKKQEAEELERIRQIEEKEFQE